MNDELEPASSRNGAAGDYLSGGEGSGGLSTRQQGQPPEFTEEALALEFAEVHASDLRYVAAWGTWLEWDGARWKRDETLRAIDLVRHICRRACENCGDEKISRTIARARTVAAVERLARADRRLAAAVEQWDADPWLLNTPAGTIDLRTGRLRPASHADYCTKITAVAPSGDCPRWLEALERITGGDAELARYLQRVAGYALTGSTKEHALFFGYGTGANGKSVFINTLADVMGDYAATSAMETFVVSHNDRHPTEIAGLRGARLVTAQETEEGRRWAESRIKSLTGGDKIAARLMRQDFFAFTPRFKLFIVGNHKPGLRGIDEAMRRRMHLIPFGITIPEGERDKDLAAKLRFEGGGILRWAIEGCDAWHREGLLPPQAVRAATDAYFAEEDYLGQWLQDCCATSANAFAMVADLFASLRAWAADRGEGVGSVKQFSQMMVARGFSPRRTSRGAGFRGISIRDLSRDELSCLRPKAVKDGEG